MDTKEIFYTDVALWSGRDLAALEAALRSSWEDCGMGLHRKKGLANRAECIISNNGGYIGIAFKSEKYIPEDSVSDETVVYIGEE